MIRKVYFTSIYVRIENAQNKHVTTTHNCRLVISVVQYLFKENPVLTGFNYNFKGRSYNMFFPVDFVR